MKARETLHTKLLIPSRLCTNLHISDPKRIPPPPSPAADLDNTASCDEAAQLTQFYAGHVSTPPRDNRASDRHEHDEVDIAASPPAPAPRLSPTKTSTSKTTWCCGPT
jgi:hypothetical protein